MTAWSINVQGSTFAKASAELDVLLVGAPPSDFVVVGGLAAPGVVVLQPARTKAAATANIQALLIIRP
jgi:hypothetical protein